MAKPAEITVETDVNTPRSYHKTRKAGHDIRSSPDAMRLFWKVFDGPLETSILVWEDPNVDPNPSLTPYCDHTTSPPTWYGVSQSSLTEPKTSSINVTVADLNDWELKWLKYHREHWEPGMDIDGRDDILIGSLPDHSHDGAFSLDYSDDEDGERIRRPVSLLRCCGEDRPRNKKASLKVKASGEFLTIHDYVSAVHPWIMGLRDDFYKAVGDLPAGTRLNVELSDPSCLRLY